jgi:hypothetical protein
MPCDSSSPDETDYPSSPLRRDEARNAIGIRKRTNARPSQMTIAVAASPVGTC